MQETRHFVNLRFYFWYFSYDKVDIWAG